VLNSVLPPTTASGGARSGDRHQTPPPPPTEREARTAPPRSRRRGARLAEELILMRRGRNVAALLTHFGTCGTASTPTGVRSMTSASRYIVEGSKKVWRTTGLQDARTRPARLINGSHGGMDEAAGSSNDNEARSCEGLPSAEAMKTPVDHIEGRAWRRRERHQGDGHNRTVKGDVPRTSDKNLCGRYTLQQRIRVVNSASRCPPRTDRASRGARPTDRALGSPRQRASDGDNAEELRSSEACAVRPGGRRGPLSAKFTAAKIAPKRHTRGSYATPTTP